MAFLRSIKRGEKVYWYLVESYRDKETGKVKQRNIKYLGTKPPPGGWPLADKDSSRWLTLSNTVDEMVRQRQRQRARVPKAAAEHYQEATKLIDRLTSKMATLKAKKMVGGISRAPDKETLELLEAYTVLKDIYLDNQIAELENEIKEAPPKTTVVNWRRSDKYDARIGRGTEFGNPYVIGKDGNREECIEKYRAYFNNRIETDVSFLLAVEKLKGKRLGCTCKPKPCHGDVIVDFLENNWRYK